MNEDVMLERSRQALARSRATLTRSDARLEESHQLCAFIRCLGPSARRHGRMIADDELRQIRAEQITTKREAAQRARRLAPVFYFENDRDNALKLSETLEAQAEELAQYSLIP